MATKTPQVRSRALLHVSVLAVASISGLALGRRDARRGDQGATAAEYALVAGLIAVVIVAAVTIFGRNVSGLFNVPSSVFNP
jgi:Flp pilus assembly pilin Flp